jgi:hypothetical protein
VADLVLLPVRDTFRAFATTVVPEAAALTATTWAEVEGLVEAALAPRSRAMRRQIQLLLRVVEMLPLLRYGRRFTELDAERRTRVVAALSDAPLLLLRRGLWGLRTLALLGYYARPEARAEIGYRADARGWEARL